LVEHGNDDIALWQVLYMQNVLKVNCF